MFERSYYYRKTLLCVRKFKETWDITRGSSRQFQYLAVWENRILILLGRWQFSVQVWWIPHVAANILYGLESKLIRILNVT